MAGLVIEVSAVLVLSCGHRDAGSDKTDADERFTPATVVGVRKYLKTDV